jgi:hypothetical protein
MDIPSKQTSFFKKHVSAKCVKTTPEHWFGNVNRLRKSKILHYSSEVMILPD